MPRALAAIALLALAGAAAIGGAGAERASAAAGARIVSFQVLEPNGAPAMRPLRFGRAYRYRVRYRIGGAPLLRVGRSLTLRGPGGRVVLRIRAPGATDEPGTFTARGRLRLRADDPTGRYVLRYTIVVRDPAGGRTARRQRTMAVRFRDPARA